MIRFRRKLVRQDKIDPSTMYELPLPTEPTSCRAGSPEKVEVMRLRWQQRVALHHPKDEQNLIADNSDSESCG